MNAATGIESDNDSVTPVGLQCELNPADNALPSPASPNHANRFTDVQLGGFHGLFAGGGEILRSASDRGASLSKHSGSGGGDLLALLAQLALRPDVPIERHGFDPDLSAECGHGGVALSHRGLRLRQRNLPAVLTPARP